MHSFSEQSTSQFLSAPNSQPPLSGKKKKIKHFCYTNLGYAYNVLARTRPFGCPSMTFPPPKQHSIANHTSPRRPQPQHQSHPQPLNPQPTISSQTQNGASKSPSAPPLKSKCPSPLPPSFPLITPTSADQHTSSSPAPPSSSAPNWRSTTPTPSAAPKRPSSRTTAAASPSSAPARNTPPRRPP